MPLHFPGFQQHHVAGGPQPTRVRFVDESHAKRPVPIGRRRRRPVDRPPPVELVVAVQHMIAHADEHRFAARVHRFHLATDPTVKPSCNGGMLGVHLEQRLADQGLAKPVRSAVNLRPFRHGIDLRSRAQEVLCGLTRAVHRTPERWPRVFRSCRGFRRQRRTSFVLLERSERCTPRRCGTGAGTGC